MYRIVAGAASEHELVAEHVLARDELVPDVFVMQRPRARAPAEHGCALAGDPGVVVGWVPQPVAQWKSSCVLLASVMFTTAGLGDARRSRSRRLTPSVQAVSAVKCGRMQRCSSAAISLTCGRVWMRRVAKAARAYVYGAARIWTKASVIVGYVQI
ncbi:hypothetical protein A0H81_13388 [Grifola frondosa]|uniref:Uncharacterized protein n=1 Tax=Grifola frondosa TaxID=5627 RepID=A0A1C7LRT0_GRIFR|nr:hypothetical protein A0H81_13388 [Grifola frondosa]